MTNNQSENAIIFSILGLLSILIGYVITQTSFGLNVHSGEIFIWLLIPLITFIVLPTMLFVKSLEVIQTKLGPEKTRIRTYSIILTTILGGVLTCMLLWALWTALS